jgi:hypothetical protein
VDPVPDALLLRKSGSAGHRTQTSGSVATGKAACGPGNTEQKETRNFMSGVFSVVTVRIIVLFAVRQKFPNISKECATSTFTAENGTQASPKY